LNDFLDASTFNDFYKSYLHLSKYKISTKVWMLIINSINETQLRIRNSENIQHKNGFLSNICNQDTFSLPTLIQKAAKDSDYATKLRIGFKQNKDIYENLYKNLDTIIQYYNVLAQANLNE